MPQLVLIAHNLRSAHNVGSLLRTADGLGVHKVFLTGYTPYPQAPDDDRLPHLAQKTHRQIVKTALGAEATVSWQQRQDIFELLDELQADDFTIAGLEQASNAVSLPDYKPPAKLVLILGRETEGLETEVMERCDVILEIPMHGKKESFNVVQAAAVALYHCRYLY